MTTAAPPVDSLGQGRAPLVVSYRSLASLKPYARNARTHGAAQIAKLEASLLEYGWTYPIAVAGNDVIAGHGRLAAATALRDKGAGIPGHPDPNQAPVIDLSHLSAKQRRAYTLADNRLSLDAEWNVDLLGEELAALKLDEFDIGAIGFEPLELFKYTGDNAFAPPPLVPPPPSSGGYVEQYGVIAVCRDAKHQEQIYNKLLAEGLNVKVVTT